MVQDTFQLPRNYEENSDIETAVPLAEYTPLNSEKHTVFKTYSPIIRMGEQIRSYRMTAVAEDQLTRKKMSLLDLVRDPSLRQSSKVTNASLINAEGAEGGDLFGGSKEHLFVLDDKNELIERQYGGTVLDFVYAKLDPKTGQSQYAIVYRVTDQSVDKIYNGRVQHMSIAELENLMNVIESYRVMIRDKFYPIDAMIEVDDEPEPQIDLPSTPIELLGAEAYAKTMQELREESLAKL